MALGISRPSVASLLLEASFQGVPLSTATGFVALGPDGPKLISNRHVFRGRHNVNNSPLDPMGGIPDAITIIHNEAGHLGQWVRRQERLYLDDGSPRWKEHPLHRDRMDVVALPLTDLDEVDLYEYDLPHQETEALILMGGVVRVIGFPFGLTGGGALALWATGAVASEPGVGYENLPLFLIDCRSRPGQSGSPVLIYEGSGIAATHAGLQIGGGPYEQIVGVYSGRIGAESDLGFVWRIEAVAEILANGAPGTA